jgi:hypothetical protein
MLLGVSFAMLLMPQTRRPIPPPDVTAFLPAETLLIKQLPVDFDQDGVDEIVLAYAREVPPSIGTGIRVLKYRPSGWTVAFEQRDSVVNGGGPTDAIAIQQITGSSGKEGLVITLKESGAGTATRWHLLVGTKNKITTLDASPLIQKALKDKGYVDNGYNSVTVQGDEVIESFAGYSAHAARCCPDRPTLEIRLKFTGASIRLDSVREIS